jgi:hypothetical protein
MSNARKKVMTGMELHMADATVVEVYLRLPLAQVQAQCIPTKTVQSIFFFFFPEKNKIKGHDDIDHACSTRLDRQNYLY